jgi:hypothetical protein
LGKLTGQGFADGGLAGSEGKGQLPVEGGQQAIGYRPSRGSFLGGELGAPPGERRLKDQCFLEPEAVPGALPVRLRLRGVDQPVGLTHGQEMFPRGDIGG